MKSFKNWCLVAGGCLFAVGFVSNAARAEYTSPDNHLPSPSYRSTNSVSFLGGQYTIDSFFDIFTEIQRVPPPAPPLPDGAHEDHFFDVFTELTLHGPGFTAIRESPTKQTLRLNGLPPGTPYIGMEISMDPPPISGGTLPPGVMIRESPSRPSLGQIRISDAGGGLFHIDSFFDVFTELSLDGGGTWIPGTNSNDGALHLEGGLPEPSSAVLALMGAVALSRFGIRHRNR